MADKRTVQDLLKNYELNENLNADYLSSAHDKAWKAIDDYGDRVEKFMNDIVKELGEGAKISEGTEGDRWDDITYQIHPFRTPVTVSVEYNGTLLNIRGKGKSINKKGKFNAKQIAEMIKNM